MKIKKTGKVGAWEQFINITDTTFRTHANFSRSVCTCSTINIWDPIYLLLLEELSCTLQNFISISDFNLLHACSVSHLQL